MSDSDFSLDFEKIESYEVSLDLTARGQICLLCVQFIGEARTVPQSSTIRCRGRQEQSTYDQQEGHGGQESPARAQRLLARRCRT